jgi:translation initiation factor eIF-2B subunit delta
MREFKNPNRIESRLASIVEDRRSGASEMALRALRLFGAIQPAPGVSAARYLRATHRLGKRVQRARPTVASIEGVVARLMYELDAASSEFDTARAVQAEVRDISLRLRDELGDVARRVVRHFTQRFGRIRRPLVISYSSRVTQAIAAMRKPHVTVCESRPALEGRRTAKLLRASSGSVTLITEAQIAIAMENCDGVVLGCDAIYPDGSIVNKAGSHLVALAADDRNLPVIVLGDTYKLTDARGGAYETHPKKQVWRGAPQGVGVQNVCFERVPGSLVGYIVMENGVFTGNKIRPVWDRAREKRLSY